jgi:nitroreductase
MQWPGLLTRRSYAAKVTLLDLTSDQLLSTTRAVRKRLDFTRDVPDELVRECVDLALQAPSGSNSVVMRFVVVRDAAKRAAVAEHYAACFAAYRESSYYAGALVREGEVEQAQQQRVASSSDYLAARMADAPVLVVGCSEGPSREAAKANMGSVLPGIWSFMLAARARGLGTAWTTLHLGREREVADILGIDYDTVAQAVLTPLAYTLGTDFKPAHRPSADSVITWI